jgi:hypothetical protein
VENRNRNTQLALEKFGKYLVTESRKNLTRKNKNNTRKLYDSLRYEVDVTANAVNFDFIMEEYGEWVDKGRKKGTMPPQKEIFKWVQKKGIQFRDNRGKFKTYESTAWAIAKSIKKRGIPATDFYSRPFNLGYAKLPNDVVQAYALDIQDFLEFSINELNKKYKDGSN